MKRSLSKILNLSNLLYSTYSEQTREVFLDELRNCSEFIVKSMKGNVEESNQRVTTLVSGLLTKILNNDAEKVIRYQSKICEKFLHEKKIENKVDYLIEEFDAFLNLIEKGEERLSDELINYIKNLELLELKNVTVESITDYFGYSFSHLSKKFKKEQGMNIQDALIYEKLNRAFKILSDENNKMNIKELTDYLGFSDPEYFRKLFKKKFGFPPSTLKNN